MNELLHKGHRERLKEKFRKEGFENWPEHEILELLLFYAIPRADTNPTAHRLIDKYGSLYAVLSAPESELKEVEGIGENAAFFLSMLPELVRAFYKSSSDNPRFINTRSAAEYLIRTMYKKPMEQLYVFCLDMSYKVIYSEKISTGSFDSVPASMRRIVSVALNHNAARVLLCHNHPGGKAEPSKGDTDVTKAAASALASVGIPLSDHIIVTENEYYSFFEHHLLNIPENNGAYAENLKAAQLPDTHI